MKKLKNLRNLLLCLVLPAALFLCGCGKTTAIDCPLTDLDWDTTIDGVIQAEGECEEPYASIYGGQVYAYPSVYMERDGRLKYMFDENDVLMSVAFAYDGKSAEALKEFYDELVTDIEKKFGKSSYETNKSTNYGKTWEQKEGKIILSVMLTDSNKALQIAYVNPLNNEKTKN